jgi:branched-chain amino acid transport system permease protein
MNFDTKIPPRLTKVGILAVVFLVVPAVLSAIGSGYFFRLANIAMLYIILSVSLNYVTGTGGLLSLCHGAFFGVGAYTAALLSTKVGLPFSLSFPLSGIVTGLIGGLVALLTMRLVSIYFTVASLAVGEMLYLTILNWVGLTRGPMGIAGISPITLFGHEFSGRVEVYLAVAAVMVISVWTIYRLTHSYYGNTIRSLREDERCCEVMGINVVRLKVEVFVVSSFFAGLAGGVLAHTSGYIGPDFFKIGESLLILAMVVVGGLGSLPGAIIGALLLLLLPEAARSIGDFRTMLVGLVMYFSILLLPKGLLGEVSAIEFARRQLGDAWGGSSKKVGWR